MDPYNDADFTNYVNKHGKDLGNSGKQLLRKIYIEGIFEKINLYNESIFKKIEKYFKRKTQVYDILTLSVTDLQNLKLAKEEEEKLQEAQELTENKAILEEIELREKEEEMHMQEAERKYNQVHQRFTETFNKEITERYIDALRSTMHEDSSQTPVRLLCKCSRRNIGNRDQRTRDAKICNYGK